MTSAKIKDYQQRALELGCQLVETLRLHLDAYRYIRENRPWLGLERYGWTVKVLLAGAILLGIYFFTGMVQVATEIVGSYQTFGAGLTSFFHDFSTEKLASALSGGKKYLVLVVLEIITFHFVQHTLEQKIGRPPDHSFGAFLRAEKRMAAVALFSWVMETVMQALVNLPLGILGLSVLEKPAGLVIQCYFVGLALVDNYHECFGLTVKESRKRTGRVAGVALATGSVAYVLMFVPLVGVVAASMLGAVTATMAMEKFAPVAETEMAALLAVRKGRKKKAGKRTAD